MTSSAGQPPKGGSFTEPSTPNESLNCAVGGSGSDEQVGAVFYNTLIIVILLGLGTRWCFCDVDRGKTTWKCKYMDWHMN